jgi:CheY-like chemotaxis protein
MKLLVIEDNEDFFAEMQAALGGIGNLEVTLAMSRNAAIERLRDNDFDLITCDLKIPTQDGALDANVDHGRVAYREALNITPGTPIIVLSAFGNEYTLPDLMDVAHTGDYFGLNLPRAMVSFLDKGRLPECVERIREFSEQVDILDGIEISPPKFELSYFEKRALRIFGRRLGGTVLSVSELGGGLSKTRTLKVRIRGDGGVHKALVAAKLGRRDLISDEKARYEKFVSPALGTGSHAGLVGEVKEGAGRISALFYKLDDPYDRSVFDLLLNEPHKISLAIDNVKQGTQPWRTEAPQRRTTVGDIRRRLIPDGSFENCRHFLDGIDLESFEQKELEIRQCAQHCDFHGSNILVDANNRTLLIDYGEVGEATASQDPIVLELSVLFHPDGKPTLGKWPTIADLDMWDDLDLYVADCPVAEFIRECRAWALEAAAGGREVFANMYGYAVRQLQYDDTNKDFAVALVKSAMRAFEST